LAAWSGRLACRARSNSMMARIRAMMIHREVVAFSALLAEVLAGVVVGIVAGLVESEGLEDSSNRRRVEGVFDGRRELRVERSVAGGVMEVSEAAVAGLMASVPIGRAAGSRIVKRPWSRGVVVREGERVGVLVVEGERGLRRAADWGREIVEPACVVIGPAALPMPWRKSSCMSGTKRGLAGRSDQRRSRGTER
jgi:hypothetical protein